MGSSGSICAKALAMAGARRYFGFRFVPLPRCFVVLGLTEIAPEWIINDYGPAAGKRFDRMANTRRHNRYQPRSGDLRHAVDSHLELAFEHSQTSSCGWKCSWMEAPRVKS
jgi:hypothetical protein